MAWLRCQDVKMPDRFTERPWDPDIQTAFDKHLRDTPSSHRISRAEADKIAQWLKAPQLRPASQAESSRRHYVRKKFIWDADANLLLTAPKPTQPERRVVVADGAIIDIVKTVHENNHHAGWDATWRDVSNAYYGILRSDVIFLLKRCPRCSENPRKRPKSLPNNGNTSIPCQRLICSPSTLGSLYLNLDNQSEKESITRGLVESRLENTAAEAKVVGGNAPVVLRDKANIRIDGEHS
jgi:hypothetical protein